MLIPLAPAPAPPAQMLIPLAPAPARAPHPPPPPPPSQGQYLPPNSQYRTPQMQDICRVSPQPAQSQLKSGSIDPPISSISAAVGAAGDTTTVSHLCNPRLCRPRQQQFTLLICQVNLQTPPCQKHSQTACQCNRCPIQEFLNRVQAVQNKCLTDMVGLVEQFNSSLHLSTSRAVLEYSQMMDTQLLGPT
ncbi:unnamed protein product [Camellia sinensis]